VTGVPRVAIAVALLAAGLVVLPGCKKGNGPGVGDIAPDFVLPALDGSVHKLSNYRGKVVLVNLWATWCPPCVAEMPILNELAKKYGARGLTILGIAGDDDPETVRGFVQESPVSFEVLLDPGGAVGTQYGITGYPESFFVDRDGRLEEKVIGPLPATGGEPSPQVAAVIEGLLGD
jgi:cytochrome c biogenesis protein CcmG/thiol:disulfide interchange protein DsbE